MVSGNSWRNSATKKKSLTAPCPFTYVVFNVGANFDKTCNFFRPISYLGSIWESKCRLVSLQYYFLVCRHWSQLCFAAYVINGCVSSNWNVILSCTCCYRENLLSTIRICKSKFCESRWRLILIKYCEMRKKQIPNTLEDYNLQLFLFFFKMC